MEVRHKSVVIFVFCVFVTVLSTPIPQTSTSNSSLSNSSGQQTNATNGNNTLNSTHGLIDEFFPILITRGELELIFFDLPDEYNTSAETNSTAQGNFSTSLKHLFRRNSEPIESEESDYEDSNSKSSTDEDILPGVSISHQGSTTNGTHVPLITSAYSPSGHLRKRNVQPILEGFKQQNLPALRVHLSKRSLSTEAPILLSNENNLTSDATNGKSAHNFSLPLFQSIFP